MHLSHPCSSSSRPQTGPVLGPTLQIGSVRLQDVRPPRAPAQGHLEPISVSSPHGISAAPLLHLAARSTSMPPTQASTSRSPENSMGRCLWERCGNGRGHGNLRGADGRPGSELASCLVTVPAKSGAVLICSWEVQEWISAACLGSGGVAVRTRLFHLLGKGPTHGCCGLEEWSRGWREGTAKRARMLADCAASHIHSILVSPELVTPRSPLPASQAPTRLKLGGNFPQL
jgi:hypothetical protein